MCRPTQNSSHLQKVLRNLVLYLEISHHRASILATVVRTPPSSTESTHSGPTHSSTDPSLAPPLPFPLSLPTLRPHKCTRVLLQLSLQPTLWIMGLVLRPSFECTIPQIPIVPCTHLPRTILPIHLIALPIAQHLPKQPCKKPDISQTLFQCTTAWFAMPWDSQTSTKYCNKTFLPQ